MFTQRMTVILYNTDCVRLDFKMSVEKKPLAKSNVFQSLVDYCSSATFYVVFPILVMAKEIKGSTLFNP